MKELLKAVKEFFCGKPASVRMAYVKPEVEKPVVQPTEEVLKLKADYERNPSAWTFGDTHFGNDHILQRGDHISIYYSEPHRSGRIEDHYISLMRPLNVKIENVADKEIIRNIYKGMTEMEDAAKRNLLKDAVNALTNTKRRLLIDMDGVLMDYYGAFVIEWKKRYPERPVLPSKYIKTFYLEEMYPPEWKQDILAITQGKDFFENMLPIAAAVGFMEQVWNSEYYDPFICTAPDMDSEDLMCATEKLRSIERLFGKKWLKKTIMTNDKTIIDGDILIDDKPEIKGAQTPSWKRVFYTHRYNRDLPGPRINHWGEWKEVLANV